MAGEWPRPQPELGLCSGCSRLRPLAGRRGLLAVPTEELPGLGAHADPGLALSATQCPTRRPPTPSRPPDAESWRLFNLVPSALPAARAR